MSLRCGALALAGAFIAGGSAMAQEPIRIGAFLSVTGPASFLGDPEQKTLEMLVERINADGGVLGRKLQLIAYDDGGDAEKARTFAKRLLEQDKVDAIVGGSTTGATMAAVPLVEAAQTPFVSLAGAVVIVEPTKKWVFKTPHTDRMACEKIFADMQGRKLTKLALISGAGGFDKSMRGECLKVAPKYGVEIVADETYGAADTDMTAQLTKIRAQRRAGGAQRRLRPGSGDRHPQLPPGRTDAAALPVARRRLDGVRQAVGPGGRGRPPARRGAAGAEQLAGTIRRRRSSSPTRDYEARYKSDVSTFGGHAYDGLMLVVDAIKRASSTDKAKVRDALEATKGYVGTGGVVKMSANDHMGLDLSAFVMLEIKERRLVDREVGRQGGSRPWTASGSSTSPAG